MTMVPDTSGQQHDVHFEMVHTIRRLAEGVFQEQFLLTRTPTKTIHHNERILNIIGMSEKTYPEAKAPWMDIGYRLHRDLMADITALVGSGYYNWEDFA